MYSARDCFTLLLRSHSAQTQWRRAFSAASNRTGTLINTSYHNVRRHASAHRLRVPLRDVASAILYGPCMSCERNSWHHTRRFSTTRIQTNEEGDPPPSIVDNHSLVEQIPFEDVRNFCFIAHIDHGKSSLSSRILELTGNLGREAQQVALDIASNGDGFDGDTTTEQAPQLNKQQRVSKDTKEQIDALDTLDVEKQRGITVKAAAASMLYPHASAKGPTGLLLLNMYDTPGHVDFGREVTRSLCFVQGAVLLLDATQGIQAQTWSVYEKVKALEPNDPKLLIALTKVDLESARPVDCALTLAEWLEDWDPDSILSTSARSRIGIKTLLDTVCEQVPQPEAMPDDGMKGEVLRAQVVDSSYDDRGVNCLVRIVSGQLKEGDRVSVLAPIVAAEAQKTDESFSVQEVGIVTPGPIRTGSLRPGQMGYTRFGLRDPRQAMPGTVLMSTKHVGLGISLPKLPSDAVAKSVLYASVHPEDADGFEELSNAVDRLALNDTGLEVTRTASQGDGGDGGGPFLGPGLRVGFQGLLHVEVFRQRLMDEHGISAVVTPPKVTYRVTVEPHKSNNLQHPIVKTIENLSDWPDQGNARFTVEEPIVSVRVVARVEDAGGVMDLLSRKRGTEISTKPLDEEKWIFDAKVPWAEVVVDFHDKLKNVTAGFGSMDTFEAGYTKANLCKVDIVLQGESVEPLAFVCHRDVAQEEARKVCKSLQQVLPRQQFVTTIQAKIFSKVIASERIQAYRKDVLTKSGKTVGGGDMTRKMKLLEKQKKGKKRMQVTGRVQLSQAAFNSVITRSS